ncbi:MAG: glycosyltransferase family 4 protein [Methylovulum sp.]|nr:glycosyltransferase family 4 protein [Methylovulum sp.]
MKILTLTTLYPNNIKTNHGVFVEQRLRNLLKIEGIEAKVIAPVPWFPFTSDKFGQYAQFARIAKSEERYGISVSHPRYPLIPKVGMTLAPILMALALYPILKRMLQRGEEFDLIDAHYFYPDGVAAAILGKMLNKPVVITARGTDINLIPKYYWPRKMIVWAAKRATSIITVCQALKDELVVLGIDPTKIHTLRNGVDLEFFYPQERVQAKQKLKIDRPTLLSVGHLIARKGHHLVIEAMPDLPEYELLIAGDGEEMQRLKNLANDLNVSDQVTFLGAVSHNQLVTIYSAVDILVLASSREGWANVLLEAMACGTPAIATNVWGTAEVITAPAAGILIEEQSAQAIVNAVRIMEKNRASRRETREYAEKFSWDETVHRLYDLFENIIKNQLA